jgi:hypothetical protein
LLEIQHRRRHAVWQDPIAELAEECKKQDIKLCFYYSQAQDWHDPNGYEDAVDNSGKDFRKYLDGKCIPQLRELLTQYGDIGMIWFDTPLGISPEESAELKDLVKSIQPECIVSGRIGNGLGDYMSTGDNFIPLLPYPGDWEVPATLNKHLGIQKRRPLLEIAREDPAQSREDRQPRRQLPVKRRSRRGRRGAGGQRGYPESNQRLHAPERRKHLRREARAVLSLRPRLGLFHLQAGQALRPRVRDLEAYTS